MVQRILIGVLTTYFVIIVECHVLKAEEFKFEGKVALVTGAGQGIGFECGWELLKNGVKGVTIVDIDPVKGQKAAKKLNEVFGIGRAISIAADISSMDQFENAFRASVNYWKHLDVVVNNAGISNENRWKMTVNVNLVGTLQGTLLGFKYMSKNKGGRGGVILNISSLAAITPLNDFPVYSATKSFVLDLGRSMGHPMYYEYNHVRILTLCPGFTRTEITDLTKLRNSISNALSPNVKKQFAVENLNNFILQSTSTVANACTQVIKEGSDGSVWVVEDNTPPYEIVFSDRSMRKKNKWTV